MSAEDWRRIQAAAIERRRQLYLAGIQLDLAQRKIRRQNLAFDIFVGLLALVAALFTFF